jgi:hypothetical protein
MKIYQVGAELFRADGRSDGQTDRHNETYFSLYAILLPIFSQVTEPNILRSPRFLSPQSLIFICIQMLDEMNVHTLTF